MSKKEELRKIHREIAGLKDVLDRIAPLKSSSGNLKKGRFFVWQGTGLTHIEKIQALPIELLLGIDHVKNTLFANTEKFAKGLPANNALLWGVRGMGKSSLVKAVFLKLSQAYDTLKIIEIHREDIETLPALLSLLRAEKKSRFILFCDDLSFDEGETSYKSLKTVLEGGLEGRPNNVLFYATSNRRHILARSSSEQNDSSALMPTDVASEKISLSDRFGLWLGFHNCNQDEYLAMIDTYVDHFSLDIGREELREKSLEWSLTRGSRSGRVAWQFIQDLAGELGVKLTTAAE